MKETSSNALFGRLTSSRWALTAAFLGGVCMALACSPQKTSLDTLRNQGLLPISAENPFMGANVLLGKEMEQSMYLYNFVKDRGAPQAIEITGEDSESMQAHFFYAPSKEEYIAKPAPRRAGSNDNRYEWIIIGPFSVDREHYRELEQYSNSGGAFEIFGRREFFGNKPVNVRDDTMLPVFIPTPKPTKASVPHKRNATAAPKSNTGVTPAATISGPPNFDQQALAEAKEKAAKNKEGDVSHTQPGSKAIAPKAATATPKK
jgi:hypothetical protein